MNPKVSVIIPNYNHSAFLGERIDSVLNQTFQDFEVIILDDCSSDNSRDIIESYRHNPKISNIIYNEANSGSTFKQWEKGIGLAKGGLIWIAESDDIADSHFLEKLVPCFKDKIVGLAYCCSNIIDDESRKMTLDFDANIDSNLGRESNIDKLESRFFLKNYMLFQNCIYNASAVVFRKNQWNEIPKDFISMKSCGDWLCWIHMLENSKIIVRFKDKLNNFRIHENKVTTRSLSNGRIWMETLIIYIYITQLKFISIFLKNAIVGYGYHQIFHSDMQDEVKEQVIRKWKINFPRDYYYVIFFRIHGLAKRLNQYLKIISKR